MKYIGGLTLIGKETAMKREMDDNMTWKKWFAWYPVTVGSMNFGQRYKRAWLEQVERRYYCWQSNYGTKLVGFWEYREIDNV